jgi:creatinine amidohydrolase
MTPQEKQQHAPGSGAALLAERIAAIPELLSETLRRPSPAALLELTRAPRFIVTGGGLSEGPARVLVSLLERAGRSARFLPLSAFAEPALPASDAVLVLFSQGLAPNARLPLVHTRSFRKTLVFTSVEVDKEDKVPASLRPLVRELLAQDVAFFCHPPEREDKLLIRVAGPAAALLCAVRFAMQCRGDSASALPLLSALPARYEGALRDGVELFGSERRPICIVAGPELCELSFPLRWKLLEGLRVPDPPVWDLLQVVHGPLQSFFDAPMTLLGLHFHNRPHERLFLDRLEALLEPRRHRLLRFELSGSLEEALLFLDARLNAALLRTLLFHPLDLCSWPKQECDGPLYAIDPEELGLTPGRR